ncbi:NAD(P)-dependent oxidoreductase [Undibacterium sp. WLHG33]|uniref:NAD(P)-dependent oxidoreductase n=1 Tax=Undibacterium sp. WLHG33 TaxID=3412482 RepID=UPI003C2CB079
MTKKIRIGFLGIGLMGRPMAIRLLEAGYELTVWNRTISKAETLRQYGARIADRPEDAVNAGDWFADVLITMLDSGPVVAEVMKQVTPYLRAGSVVIDMSSTRQSEAKALDEALLHKGVAFADAPVSGGVIGAQAGTLAIMVGARPDTYAQIEQILQVFGRPTHVGAAGCGQLAKLCNQLIVGGTINIVAEALLLAQAGGADPVAVRQALRGGFAESRILEVHGQRMLDRSFIPGGQVKTQTKDMENIQSAASDAGLSLPLTNLVTDIYRHLSTRYPTADHSAALLELERVNGGIRLGVAPDQLP